jgi:hypothetical protein
MFRLVHRSSSGVVNVPRAITTTGYAQQNILQVVIARGTLTTPDDDR